jgi:anaerobic selenocysteine-containing dehydrogenase
MVTVADGAISEVTGDPDNRLYDGYTCIKGRAQPALHDHPQRLRSSQKRLPDGTFVPVSSEDAMDEVSERLAGIVERYGARAIAAYLGNGAIANCTAEPFLSAFLRAVGSPMYFTPATIDKPGKPMARALHGTWMAPQQGYDRPDVALLLGLNPFKSYFGVACGHPAKWLGERMRQGMELIVVDPRASDIAKRATLHIQPVPGEDPAILACLIHVIIDEKRFDRAFVDENAQGLETLARAVAQFTPGAVAARADVSADDLVRAARTFAAASRGYVASGVGPSFSTSSTLVEYLVLCLETLCGHWLREGERVVRTPTLMPAARYKAQALPPKPAYGYGERLRVHGLTSTAAGLPTGALADEILLEGDGQVRALFSMAGNPVSAWPDQLKAIRAMQALDLLVQFDPWMSSTARLADYVIAPKMSYETPGTTILVDGVMAGRTFYGPAEAYAHYTPAIVDPPAGSDVIAEWEFFYGLARRMHLQLELRPPVNLNEEPRSLAVDMEREPTADRILELLSTGSRVPLQEVKRHPHGAAFPEPALCVEPKDPGWTGRFELADADMMRDLAALLDADDAQHAGRDATEPPERYPFRLICQRLQHMFNSSVNVASTNRGRGYNPACMHPADLADLGLAVGDSVEISSPRAVIRGIVQPDASLRRGLVAMAHGFGDSSERDDEFREIGSPTGRLLDGWDFADPYVGMPRMSNIPVAIRPLASSELGQAR